MVDFTYLLSYMHHIDTLMSAIFLVVGMFLSILIGFPQLRKGRRFLQVITSTQATTSTKNTISPLQALLTAMSTSLVSGSIAGVPLAIVIGEIGRAHV